MNIIKLASNLAINDNLIISPIYFWDDFHKLTGGTIEDYKDYLVLQQGHVKYTQSKIAARVIYIPFDKYYFQSWQLLNQDYDHGINAHAAWALDISQNKKQLSQLLKKHPILPKPPVNEKTVSVTFYTVLLASVNQGKLSFYEKSLPYKELRYVLSELRSYCELKKFKSLSDIRCEGVKTFIGDSFIRPLKLEKLNEHLFSSVVTLDGIKKQVVNIPLEYKIIEEPIKSDTHILELILLPIILVGSVEEIAYMENSLVCFNNEIETISEVICDMAEQNGVNRLLHDTALIIPSHDIDILLNSITEQMISIMEELDNNGIKKIVKKHKKNKSHLHRVK